MSFKIFDTAGLKGGVLWRRRVGCPCVITHVRHLIRENVLGAGQRITGFLLNYISAYVVVGAVSRPVGANECVFNISCAHRVGVDEARFRVLGREHAQLTVVFVSVLIHLYIYY